MQSSTTTPPPPRPAPITTPNRFAPIDVDAPPATLDTADTDNVPAPEAGSANIEMGVA